MGHIKGHINESLSIFSTKCKFLFANSCHELIFTVQLYSIYFNALSAPRLMRRLQKMCNFSLIVKLDQAFQLFLSRSFNLNLTFKV